MALLEIRLLVGMIKPRNNRVLIRRLEEPSKITLTDAPKAIKGKVLAVGPGKWHPGEWRWVTTGYIGPFDTQEWKWVSGWREPMEVKPGMLVLFNSKWNDLAHAENVGTGADGKGPLERPLSYKLDKLEHLVTEDDIFCIIGQDVSAKLGQATLEREFMVNRKIPGPWSE